MSKTVKLLTVLIFTTYHSSFAISSYHSAPGIIYRQRKSGTWSSWPRSFKVNRPRKAFEIRDRKTFDISDIYTEKFLKDIDYQIVTKVPMIQQWNAAVEIPSRKKNRFLEMAQKPRQEENGDTVQSEELPSNFLEGPTEKLKNLRKEKQKIKEDKRQENQNKNDRQRKEDSLLNPKTPVQNKPKRLQPEQDRNVKLMQNHCYISSKSILIILIHNLTPTAGVRPLFSCINFHAMHHWQPYCLHISPPDDLHLVFQLYQDTISSWQQDSKLNEFDSASEFCDVFATIRSIHQILRHEFLHECSTSSMA